MVHQADIRKIHSAVLTLIICALSLTSQSQALKSVIYDFDGFDLGASDLPEGDYSFGDLSYQAAVNPSQASDVLGDRVLRVDLNWSANYGAFGRGISRYLELSKSEDFLNFYFYNPLSNLQPAIAELGIADDDNLTFNYEPASDDFWKTSVSIPGGNGWQLVSVPMAGFTDSNAGGNNIFDIGWSANKGMLLVLEFRFNRPSATSGNATFYIDMVSFSEGILPTGQNVLEPPVRNSNDYCRIGAHQYELPGNYHLVPTHFEGMFPSYPGRKLKYVNTYLHWATNGSTTPHALPGQGYQTLMDNGYLPIITWEPLFSGYSTLDPVQPRLNNIINGDYDTYIDAFADKIKTYTDTIIIRPMHEFDGDWYAWCISQNNQDPQKFINAYRHIVDRFNAKNVGNVLWMWCPNSDPVPHRYWNWMVSAYPGDSYVDIVATDIYNAHYPPTLPWWRSFRWQTTEAYYYLKKYFPSKPIVICELACRERQSSEPATSQSKAGWWQQLDKDLQTYFSKVRGIIFFSESKDQSWAINTSSSSLNSLRDNIWYDDYYFPSLIGDISEVETEELTLAPQPCNDELFIRNCHQPFTLQLTGITGIDILSFEVAPNPDGISSVDTRELTAGIYLATLQSEGKSFATRLVVVID
jgi:beta-mannanase